MFLLDILPNWAFYIFIAIGIIGLIAAFFMQFMPWVSTYRTQILIASIISLTIGVWFDGGITNQIRWEAKVVSLEKKLADASVKSAESNTKLVQKVDDKIAGAKATGDNITKYIDREIVKYNNVCIVPKEAITAVNAAALGKDIK
jgi:hypothetical protein